MFKNMRRIILFDMLTLANLSMMLEFGMQCVLQALEYVFLAR